ncbi:MAG: KH domain-containing protein [Chlamydiales bacterium]
MKEFFEYIIKNIVDHPDEVKVQIIEGNVRTIIEISVGEKDIGQVVGKKGKTIDALRSLSIPIGARLGRKVKLELLQ